jgi:hypothetical protein
LPILDKSLSDFFVHVFQRVANVFDFLGIGFNFALFHLVWRNSFDPLQEKGQPSTSIQTIFQGVNKSKNVDYTGPFLLYLSKQVMPASSVLVWRRSLVSIPAGFLAKSNLEFFAY